MVHQRGDAKEPWRNNGVTFYSGKEVKQQKTLDACTHLLLQWMESFAHSSGHIYQTLISLLINQAIREKYLSLAPGIVAVVPRGLKESPGYV